MLKSFQLLLLVFLFGNLFSNASCAQDRETWYGEYYYSETPVKANAGYNMVMGWNLTVYPGNENTMELGVLEIMGQQTDLKFNVYVQGNQDNFLVFFDETVSENDEGLKKGDILFSLKKVNEGWLTTWGALQPRLASKFERECNDCFAQVESTSEE